MAFFLLHVQVEPDPRWRDGEFGYRETGSDSGKAPTPGTTEKNTTYSKHSLAGMNRETTTQKSQLTEGTGG